MSIMIELTIGRDGAPDKKVIDLGNKFENLDEEIHFHLPEEFENYNKYLISVIKIGGKNITHILPINDDKIKISVSLTSYAGNWNMYVTCRQKSTIDLDDENIDIAAKDDEHVFMSDGFIGRIFDSDIDREEIEKAPLDSNLKLIYVELFDLKRQLEEKIGTPTSWDELTNVPTEFNPAPHTHDDRYFTKEEMNTKLDDKVDKIDGKGLSSNDFTDTQKIKLGGVEEGAQANVIESINVNGKKVEPSQKAINLSIPTNISELKNDSDFVDASSLKEELKSNVKDTLTNSDVWTTKEQTLARKKIKAQGYGTWELIEEIVTTEDMLRFEIAQTPDGKDYNFQAMKVIIKAPSGQKTGLYDLNLWHKNANGNFEKLLHGLTTCYANNYDESLGYYSSAVFQAIPNYGFYNCVSSSGTQGGIQNLLYAANGDFQTVDATIPIEKFSFFIYQNVPIVAGTRIQIWAVWNE